MFEIDTEIVIATDNECSFAATRGDNSTSTDDGGGIGDLLHIHFVVIFFIQKLTLKHYTICSADNCLRIRVLLQLKYNMKLLLTTVLHFAVLRITFKRLVAVKYDRKLMLKLYDTFQCWYSSVLLQ